jgi:hypothetical protein
MLPTCNYVDINIQIPLQIQLGENLLIIKERSTLMPFSKNLPFKKEVYFVVG